MISCTDFIPAYSEIFKYLHTRGGKENVENYWKMLSGNVDETRLGKALREKGIAGCWDYWNHTLNEEAAEFTMTLDEDAGEFSIDMHLCPSRGRFLKPESAHVTPYPHYCEHCIIYKDAVEAAGYEYYIDLSNTDRAACRITVTDPGKSK